MTSLTGRLKFFHADRGYGYIVPADGGPDVFVHVSAPREPHFWRKALPPHGCIRFDVIPGRDGKPRAINLQQEQP